MLCKLLVNAGTLCTDFQGLRFTPRYSREAVVIPWDNVSFVHIVPALRKEEGAWKTFDSREVSVEALQDVLTIYTVEFALKDRHALLQGITGFTRFWLRWWMVLKPLYDANDKPKAEEGVLSLELSKRQVKKQAAAFMGMLELFDAHCRFDLICYE